MPIYYQQDETDEKSNSFLLSQTFHNLSQDRAGSCSFTSGLIKFRWVRWYTVVCPQFESRSRACEVQMGSRSTTTSVVGKDDDRRRISCFSRSWQHCCISWSSCRVFRSSSLSLVASSWRMPIRSRFKQALLPSTSCRRETSLSRSVAGTSRCTVVMDEGTGGTSTNTHKVGLSYSLLSSQYKSCGYSILLWFYKCLIVKVPQTSCVREKLMKQWDIFSLAIHSHLTNLIYISRYTAERHPSIY